MNTEYNHVQNSVNEDEIDLFELIETLWQEKISIILITVLSFVLGLGYVLLADERFEVRANYTLNSSALESDEITKRLPSLLPAGWGVDARSASISQSTMTPSPVDQYRAELQSVVVQITDSYLNESLNDIRVIETELPVAVQSTEVVATRMLRAKQLINELQGERAKTLITIGEPAIVKVAPKTGLILALSVVLGGMLGVMFVLIRSAVRKRKAQAS